MKQTKRRTAHAKRSKSVQPTRSRQQRIKTVALVNTARTVLAENRTLQADNTALVGMVKRLRDELNEARKSAKKPATAKK